MQSDGSRWIERAQVSNAVPGDSAWDDADHEVSRYPRSSGPSHTRRRFLAEGFLAQYRADEVWGGGGIAEQTKATLTSARARKTKHDWGGEKLRGVISAVLNRAPARPPTPDNRPSSGQRATSSHPRHAIKSKNELGCLKSMPIASHLLCCFWSAPFAPTDYQGQWSTSSDLLSQAPSAAGNMPMD